MLKFSNMSTSLLKQKVQVVTISQGQLLLLEFHSSRGDGFQNITGGVEDDETFLEGARRELLEEIGVASNVIDVQYTHHFHDRWGADVEEKIFLFNPPAIPEIRLSEEHQSYKWVPVEKVTTADFTFPSNYEAFLKAKGLAK